MSLIMLLGMMAVFYFMLIRPEGKRRKERDAMLGALKVGDKVRTNGGILGEITRLNESDATLEIADRVRINVLRNSLGGVVGSDASDDAAAEKKS
jgi:preprotein translocase subunit YajC